MCVNRVFFLLMSAGFLTYRLLHLQAQLDLASHHGWHVSDREYQHIHSTNDRSVVSRRKNPVYILR